jgi:hypothetical protein
MPDYVAPFDSLVTAPRTPEELSAYYHKAAPMVDMIMAEKLSPDDRIYNAMYNGRVTTYDPAGKGISRRTIELEHKRTNATFSTDWQMWKRGCGPQQWDQQAVGRPNTSDRWSYLMHLSKVSGIYHLPTIITESLNLPKQLEADMLFLEDFRRDTYAEYFRNFHATFAGRRWMHWKDAAGAYHFDQNVGGGSRVAPWRFGTSDDGCLNTTDKIFINDAATDAVTKVLAFTPPCARKIQSRHMSDQRNGAFQKVRLITSDVAPTEIFEADDVLVETLKRRDLGQGIDGAVLWQALDMKRKMGDLLEFAVDLRILRYKSTGETNDAGEFELVRVPQFLDELTGSGDHGTATDINPDWENPLVAAFEVYVVDKGPIFDPMRPIFDTNLGHGMTFGPRPYASWNWYNVQDGSANRNREFGYFAMDDDMMAQATAAAKTASVILVRRRPDDFNSEDISAALVESSYTDATSEISCATLQPFCAPPGDCPPVQDGFAYGYGEASPSCPNCM